MSIPSSPMPRPPFSNNAMRICAYSAKVPPAKRIRHTTNSMGESSRLKPYDSTSTSRRASCSIAKSPHSNHSIHRAFPTSTNSSSIRRTTPKSISCKSFLKAFRYKNRSIIRAKKPKRLTGSSPRVPTIYSIPYSVSKKSSSAYAI